MALLSAGKSFSTCRLRIIRRLCPKPVRSHRLSCSASATVPRVSRGALIVFEGIDRCGKSTQCAKLVESLRSTGVEAELWRFPDRTTPLGLLINDYLRSDASWDATAVHLMFTGNRFEKRDEMLRLLAAGTTLVLDRYSYSGVAYTAAKGLPQLGPAYCRSVEVGLPAADLVVHMRISPEASAGRTGFGRERYEKLEFQRKVMEQYETLQDDRWLAVDALRAEDDIHSQVLVAAQQVIKAAERGAPLGRLWDYQPLELPQGRPLET